MHLSPSVRAAAALLPRIYILAGRLRGNSTGSEVKPEPSPSLRSFFNSSAALTRPLQLCQQQHIWNGMNNQDCSPVTMAPEGHRYHGTRVRVKW